MDIACLSSELGACAQIRQLTAKEGQVKYHDSDLNGRDSPQFAVDSSDNNNNISAGNTGGSLLGFGTRFGSKMKSMRKSYDTSSQINRDHSCVSFGNSSTSINNNSYGMKNRDNFTKDPFRNQAFLLLNTACRNAINSADFPMLNGEMLQGNSNAVNNRSNGLGVGKRTLRMGLAQLQQNNTIKSNKDTYNTIASTLCNPADTSLTLDLGHEGQYPLQDPSKIILFIIGGVTCGEMRAAYEISIKHGRECIIGSTSLLRPDGFVAQLKTLHT
uniref:Protein transport protein sec1 n=1 Tax=Lygus hesperus TaxID=30085 RepID=A0A0A9YAL5_LYGHE